MTIKQFNQKYKNYLENSFYGNEYTKQPNHKLLTSTTYSQIKLKFGTTRVYTQSNKILQ